MELPLKEEAKPFRKKLRQINPMLLPIMEREVKKLLDAHIIIPLRFSEWVANLVPVRKKNGEIRLFADCKNLNRSSKKDKYPLSKMENIFHRLNGSSRLSMIDGFSSYNQIYVVHEDREKTTFTTPWGTFMYAKIPLWIDKCRRNLPARHGHYLYWEKDTFVVICLDDITLFSSSDKEHCHHLKKVFLKCRRFGLSLNPKKTFFLWNRVNYWGILCHHKD
jgi:hypothetical protein